jgi:hypothetical protein
MDFVRDYLGILPGIIAVVNGALAALLSHYPFKTPAGKLRFIVIVGLLSFAAVGATIYSQHLIVAQRNEERAQRDIIREKLGTFIEEGTRLMNQCRDSSKPPPVDAINEWVSRVYPFLTQSLGKSYIARFNDPSGVPPQGPVGVDNEHQNAWFAVFQRVFRLEQFSQELPH